MRRARGRGAARTTLLRYKIGNKLVCSVKGADFAVSPHMRASTAIVLSIEGAFSAPAASGVHTTRPIAVRSTPPHVLSHRMTTLQIGQSRAISFPTLSLEWPLTHLAVAEAIRPSN